MASLMTPVGALDAVYPTCSLSGTPCRRNTYAVGFTVTLAANPTDVVEIIGAAGKRIYIDYIQVAGVASPSSAGFQFLIQKRGDLNTGGSSSSQSLTAVNSVDATTRFATPACSATVKSYTANPAALGTLIGTIGSYIWTIPIGSSTLFRGENNLPYLMFPTAPMLNSATETLCINLAGTTGLTSLTFTIVLSEES